MNHSELIKALAERTEMTQLIVKQIINALPEIIIEGLLSDGDVSIKDVGKFVTVYQEQRAGRNPATGESLTIPAKNVVRFKPAKEFKEHISFEFPKKV